MAPSVRAAGAAGREQLLLARISQHDETRKNGKFKEWQEGGCGGDDDPLGSIKAANEVDHDQTH